LNCATLIGRKEQSISLAAKLKSWQNDRLANSDRSQRSWLLGLVFVDLATLFGAAAEGVLFSIALLLVHLRSRAYNSV